MTDSDDDDDLLVDFVEFSMLSGTPDQICSQEEMGEPSRPSKIPRSEEESSHRARGNRIPPPLPSATRIESGVFSNIPPEVIHNILKFLSSEDLISCSIVCKFMCYAASDESLWRRLYCMRWGLPSSKLRASAWKNLYIQRDREDMSVFVRNTPSEFKEYYIQMQAAKRSRAPLPSQVNDDHIILDTTIADQVSIWRSRRGFTDESVAGHICSGDTCTYSQIGDVFLCDKTGRVHVCDDTCRETVWDQTSGLLVCTISGQCFDIWFCSEDEDDNMSLQNTAFTVQLGRGANICLANVVINTGEEGAIIQFGNVNFPSIVTQNTTAPASTAFAQGQVRRARDGEIPNIAVDVPRKRISVFERLSAPEAPTLKRRVIGLMPVSTLATLSTEPFAPGRHDVKASSSGTKLSRRQRRKKNAELRAQQLLSELSASSIQQTPGETSSPTREENIHTSENAENNFNNTLVSEADTTTDDVSATGNPTPQSLEVSRVVSSTLREDSNAPISESPFPNFVKTRGPSRSRLQETVVLDMLGHVEDDDSLPVSDLYESQIWCRVVFDEIPLAWQYREVSIHFLRDIILHLDPQVPTTYHDFVKKANCVLDSVAYVGLREEVLRFWEGACRQVEFLIEKLKTFNWVRFNASLPELQRRVECCGAATDLARDDLNKSIEITKRQENTWVNTSIEFESYTSKLKKLWQEVTTLLSYRAKVQETLHHNIRDIVKGQQSRQLCQQTFEVAEAAFIRAKEEWKIAQAEQPSFLRLTSRLDHLKAQLAKL